MDWFSPNDNFVVAIPIEGAGSSRGWFSPNDFLLLLLSESGGQVLA